MAYGDNRQQVASDTFDSTIDSSWTSGPGDYEDIVWATGGHVEPAATFGEPALKRNTGTYEDDQYCRITVQSFGSGVSEIWALVRMQSSDTDESCYTGTNTASGDQHAINEVNSSLGITNLTSTNTDPDNPGTGDILTIEAEGTTLRYGDTMNGADAQRLTTTDNTITSGRPGFLAFSASGTSSTQITAWSGGDIAVVHTADGDATIPLITASGVTAYTGTGSPSIPLITADGDATVTPASSLSITSVSGDDEWTDGDTGIPIVGVGFV